MCYTYADEDNIGFHYVSSSNDTAVASTNHYRFQSNATKVDNFSLDLSYMWTLPKPKRVKSKWLEKKLRKLGR